MATSVKIRGKYQITIPDDVRRKIPLKIGERVEVIARGGEIVIRPIVEIPRNQAWFWSKEWQEQITQSIKDIQKGKIKVFKFEKRKTKGDRSLGI